MLKNSILPIVAFALFSQLDAVTVKTECFEAEDSPAELGSESFAFDRTIVMFEDLPKNRNVSISIGRLSENYEMKNLGLVSTSNKGATFAEVSSMGYFPGEPVKISLKGPKNIKKEITIVPWSICATSSVDNATVTATLSNLFPDPIYTVDLENFKENEVISYKSISHHEVIETNHVVNKKYTSMVLPAVVDHPGGVASLTITRPSGETLSIELPWGLEWLKYKYFYDDQGNPKRLIDSKELKKSPVIEAYFKADT